VVYPVIASNKQNSYLPLVNNDLYSKFVPSSSEREDCSAENPRDNPDTSKPYYSETVELTVNRNTNGVICIPKNSTYYYEGAAYPGENVVSYCFDMISSVEIDSLDDIFVGTYRSFIVSYIATDLETQFGNTFWNDSFKTSDESYEVMKFTISEDSLILTWDAYILAAGAYGPITVELPLSSVTTYYKSGVNL